MPRGFAFPSPRAEFWAALRLDPEDKEAALELARVLRTGSNGVVLQSPDLPEVRSAVAQLAAAQIPVVTLASDLPGSLRRGYVGADNRGAGATAAYLLTQWVPDPAEPKLYSNLLRPMRYT